ncbi:hypothetical protein BSFA1_82140 (plasmid) [Burkholderia sp. SFA1]|nr:hypothetical protein BYI23_E003360 [Burkholderia sp. YI23]BBQ03086.1 hypothetical protein BSFA1_82140 [Burkholderia sp. SFA1]
MPSFNIYVLGDVSSFYATLNAVAMIFAQKGFLNSAFMVGGLVMLISGILYMIGKQSDGSVPGVMGPISGMFGLFAVVWTSTIPTSVMINDIYTGNVAKVDNVPLIISVPASAFTTASNRIFQLANTAFQATSGSYMAVGEQGFMMPLKILFSLRGGFDNADANLDASLRSFILDCIPNSDTFSMDALKQSANSVDYILQNGRPNGLTTYWPSADAAGNPSPTPQAQSVSCSQAKALIDTDVFGKFFSGSNKNLMNLMNQNMKDKNPHGASYTQDDAANAWAGLIPATWQAAQSATTFMSNALTYNTITNTFNCMGANGSQASYDMCNVQMTQAFEQSRTDAAAAGSFFSKMMMPAMIFMQLMFFGFAPLVVIYGVMKGGGALGMYVKYLLFGIWTSSWLPFAAVIQMYIQNDVLSKFAEIKSNGLTLGNFSPIYYDLLASRLSVASDMLAATPLVSLAMLTGSAMAVTSLAGRWSGRDHVDERQSSPDLLKNGGLVDVGAAAKYGPSQTGDRLSGSLRTDASLPSFRMGEATDNSVSSASAQVASSRAEAAQSFERLLNQMKTHSTGSKVSDSDISGIAKDYSSRASQVHEQANAMMDRLGFSQEQKSSVQAGVEASGGFSSPFGGVKVTAQAIANASKGKVSAEEVQSSMSSKIGTDESWATSITNKAQHAVDHYVGDDNKTAQGLAASARESIGRVQQAEQSFQRATSLKNSVGADFSVQGSELGAKILANPAAKAELDKDHAEHLNDSGYHARYEAARGQVARAGDIRGGEELARFMALAGHKGGMVGAATVLSMLSGVSAPKDFDANANQNVGAAANAVPADPSRRALSLRDPHVLAHSAPSPSGGASAPGSGPTATGRGSGPAARQPANHRVAPTRAAAPSAPTAGGSPANMNDLQSRVNALAANSIPDFDAHRAELGAKTGGVDQAIADQRADLGASVPVLSAEQVQDVFHREVGTVQNALAGAGMAYGDFEQAHPVLAAGIEIGMTMIPAVRLASGGMKVLKLSRVAQEGWKGVEAAKAGVSAALKEKTAMEAAFTSKNGALLGGGRTLDARRVADMGFKSTDEFLDAYAKAGKNVIGAEKHLAETATDYTKKFGASLGEGGLPKDATIGFVAKNASSQVASAGKSAGGAAWLSMSKYEANVHQQELEHEKEVRDLRKGVRGR